jgi:hypothetical protein
MSHFVVLRLIYILVKSFNDRLHTMNRNIRCTLLLQLCLLNNIRAAQSNAAEEGEVLI